MSNQQLDGWNESETIEFFMSNRKTYNDLYESEKFFLQESFLKNIETILDVGCSVGGMYNIFQSLNNDVYYTGLDVSDNAIENAKKLHTNKFTKFYHYNGVSEFPIPDKSYDLVFSTGVMHLIDNYKYIVSQMIQKSNKYILLDFRLTKNSSYTGKFYFSFSDKKDISNSTNYHVINFKEIINFFNEFQEISQINIYGYKGNASEMSEGIDDVYMVFFKIQLGTKANAKIDTQFENEELENIFGNEK